MKKADVWQGTMESLLVVIPAHNESQSVEKVILDLKQQGCDNILLVDDASTDNTAALGKTAGAKVLSLPFNLGAWKATQAGIRYGMEKGFEHILTFDADGQHLGESIPLMSNLMQTSNVNVVIGACLNRGSLLRHLAWRFFRKISGLNVQDLTSGLRLYNREAISVLSDKSATMLEYQDVGVLLLLKAHQLRIVEVDVPMNKREAGVSRIFYSWGAVAYYMAYTALLSVSKARKILADDKRS